MANLKISRSDLFPVGTTVKAYASGPRGSAAALLGNAIPSGASVEEHAVDAEGNVTFTTLVSGKLYVLFAEVSGEKRSLLVQGVIEVNAPLSVNGRTRKPRAVTLRERIRIRRNERGAMAPAFDVPSA
jgi:hypothetical protein